MIEKKFINQSDFDVPVLSLGSLVCEEKFSLFDLEMKKAPQENPLASKYDNCLFRKKKGFFLLKERKFVVLRTIGLIAHTKEQKEKYKVMFKRWNFAEDLFPLECALKYSFDEIGTHIFLI